MKLVKLLLLQRQITDAACALKVLLASHQLFTQLVGQLAFQARAVALMVRGLVPDIGHGQARSSLVVVTWLLAIGHGLVASRPIALKLLVLHLVLAMVLITSWMQDLPTKSGYIAQRRVISMMLVLGWVVTLSVTCGGICRTCWRVA